MGKALSYDSLHQLRQKMFAQYPRFAKIDMIEPAAWGFFGKAGATGTKPFASKVENFYLSNVICRASETMAECSNTFVIPVSEAAE
jgi:NADH-quinone oxidoreductase subunit G